MIDWIVTFSVQIATWFRDVVRMIRGSKKHD